MFFLMKSYSVMRLVTRHENQIRPRLYLIPDTFTGDVKVVVPDGLKKWGRELP